jgi:protein-disulfide isomerase
MRTNNGGLIAAGALFRYEGNLPKVGVFPFAPKRRSDFAQITSEIGANKEAQFVSTLQVSVGRIMAAAVFILGLSLNISGQNAGLSAAAAQDKPAGEGTTFTLPELVYGNPDAPITIVEYASLTCPHCAAFHSDVLPDVKTKLLDTGKARLVFRHFPLDQIALRASVLVSCVPPERSTAMLDVLFSTQSTWARSQDPVAALARIGRGAGMSDAYITGCYENQPLIEAVIAERLEAEKTHQVESTPSFVIEGKLYRGGMTAEKMAVVVESLAK